MAWIRCATPMPRRRAGQRPPELTGRDREIAQFEVVLERVARDRPERSMVLTGLRIVVDEDVNVQDIGEVTSRC